MSLNLVTVRARTRGRNPQEFQYQGIGRLSERPVMSTEKDAKGEFLPVKREDGTVIIVDDIDASGITDNVQEVVDLYGSLSADERKDKTPIQLVIDGALNWFNVISRKAASPVSEVVTEDELSPLVAELHAAGLFTPAKGATVGVGDKLRLMTPEDVETTWRRTVSMAAAATDQTRIKFAEDTKQVKALRILQAK